MPKTSFYLSKDLQTKLRLSDERGLSMSANRAIDRYYAIVEAERKKLDALFTKGEWNFMRNACNGTIWEPAEVIRGGVLADCEDGIDEDYDFYNADRKILIKKLRDLNVSQQFALVELIEEWWDKNG
jgi:hypothetical protein